MDELYSDLAPWKPVLRADVPVALHGALDELSGIPRCRVDGLVKRASGAVGVCLSIEVDLPSRGPVDKLDVRAHEPLLLIFWSSDDSEPPEVCSDRKSFPQDRLAHLNPRSPGQPPSLCLFRGDTASWFAEHSLSDLVESARGWLSDAAAGTLVRAGDAFEFVRVDPSAGILVADEDWLTRTITAGTKHFCVMRMLLEPKEQLGYDNDGICYELGELVPKERVAARAKVLKKLNDEDEKGGQQRHTFGVVFGPTAELTHYCSTIPDTFEGLAKFARELGVDDLPAALADLIARQGNLRRGLPVVIGVRRPARVYGKDAELEWVAFTVTVQTRGGKVDPASKVQQLSIRAPFTTAVAQGMSAATSKAAHVVLGCGALGSKVAFHLARSGLPPRAVVDPAVLAPHNMARHALLAPSLGVEKAVAVRDEVLRLFKASPTPPRVQAFVQKAGRFIDAQQSLLKDCSVVVDATASPAVLARLAAASLPSGLRVVRTEIAHYGRLGIVTQEGDGRNPRIDDLQAALFDEATRDEGLAAWLRESRLRFARNHGGALDEVRIGIGCATQTFVMDDARVSMFAARAGAQLVRGLDKAGLLSLMRLSDELDVRTTDIRVDPVLVLDAGGGWSARVAQRAVAKMQEERAKAGDAETGGIMVGYFHMKRRVAYVTDVLLASSDSRGSGSEFRRGVVGYRETLARIHDSTGLLGYAGEWHTHPVSAAEPSERDREAARQITTELRAERLPTHIMILGTDGLRSYIYADHR